jgi:hypothetical protein
MQPTQALSSAAPKTPPPHSNRPTDLSGYYLTFNGRLGRLVMDYELKEAGALSAGAAARTEGDAYPHAHLEKASADGKSDVAAARSDQDAKGKVPAAPVGSAGEAAAAAKAAGLEGASAGEAVAAASAGDVGSAAAAIKDLATGGGGGGAAAGAAASAMSSGRGPARRVLMGHSLGGACAALEAISHPDDYAALVLVSPAILVGFGVGGGKETWLEQLHDDTALTRAHGGGAAAAGASSSSQSDGGSQSDGERELASAAAAAQPRKNKGGYTAKVPGSEVAYYVARGEPERPKEAKGKPGLIGQFMGAIMSVMQVREGGGSLGSVGDQIWSDCYTGITPDLTCLPSKTSPPHPHQPSSPQTTMISAVVALILLMRPLVLLGLRAAVRSRDFWKNTLQQCYYDKDKVGACVWGLCCGGGVLFQPVNLLHQRHHPRPTQPTQTTTQPPTPKQPQVSPEAVDAYRLPQLVRGWESGMVRFLLARLGAKGRGASDYTDAGTGRAPGGGLEDAGLAQRLAAAVAEHRIPVLVVHGAGERLGVFVRARLVCGALQG